MYLYDKKREIYQQTANVHTKFKSYGGFFFGKDLKFLRNCITITSVYPLTLLKKSQSYISMVIPIAERKHYGKKV